jgi:hypothetical protein
MAETFSFILSLDRLSDEQASALIARAAFLFQDWLGGPVRLSTVGPMSHLTITLPDARIEEQPETIRQLTQGLFFLGGEFTRDCVVTAAQGIEATADWTSCGAIAFDAIHGGQRAQWLICPEAVLRPLVQGFTLDAPEPNIAYLTPKELSALRRFTYRRFQN